MRTPGDVVPGLVGERKIRGRRAEGQFVRGGAWVVHTGEDWQLPNLPAQLPGLGNSERGRSRRWLLLSRWIHPTAVQRQELNQLFALNRKVSKAYLLKESLDRLWMCHNPPCRLQLTCAIV
jgi:Transposase